MTDTLKLPVGIENFEEIRNDGFYYADKTGLIEQLLNQWGKVNLFTRPRRFGKTLNMSMPRYFFEIGTEPAGRRLRRFMNADMIERCVMKDVMISWRMALLFIRKDAELQWRKCSR